MQPHISKRRSQERLIEKMDHASYLDIIGTDNFACSLNSVMQKSTGRFLCVCVCVCLFRCQILCGVTGLWRF